SGRRDANARDRDSLTLKNPFPLRERGPGACSWTCAMKIAQASRLIELVTAIMHRAGCDADEAATVARRLVDANLVGHDSHGVLRVGKYLEWMRVGWLMANQTASVVVEND